MDKTIANNLIRLCQSDSRMTHPNGDVNHNAVSRILEIPQSTVTRVLNSQGKGVSLRTLKAFADYFNVPLEAITSGDRLRSAEGEGDPPSSILSKDPLVEEIKNLNPEERLGVLAYIDALKARRAKSG
ncbi:MAG: helix-turn-helix transcriptional regulator [Porticoccaceae bacterium]|nr:helix-turn-helix transcriptional regulator [Porticoccaceae bacterium]